MSQSSVVIAALIPNSLISLHIIRETGESVDTLQVIVGEAAMKKGLDQFGLRARMMVQVPSITAARTNKRRQGYF
jgi:hypothetical protein